MNAPTRCTVARALLALTLLVAGFGVNSAANAQAPTAPQIVPTVDTDTRVLPVWSNASGRIEALLLLDADQPDLSGSTLERVLHAPSVGLGAQLRTDQSGTVRGSLQFEPDGGLALLCDDRLGLTAAMASLGDHCLLASLAPEDPLLAGAAHGATLGLGWQSPQRWIDLNFGLSWLELDPQNAAWNPVGAPATPGLDALLWAQRLESRNFRIDSLITLGPQTRLLMGGDVGRSRLLGADGTPMTWETAALSLGLGHGDFTGRLTGRLIELPRSGNQLSTLDIGLSWRTPWRGEISVGARNVLGDTIDTSRWPLAELPPVEDPSARVPYVRYQQDL